MAQYMLLLYATQEERDRQWTNLPDWDEFAESLREVGRLISSNALWSADSATTVRVRDGETEIVDGPFAVTKEMLGGYCLIECADLDAALRIAERVPLARYGSVEVRPVMDAADRAARAQE